MYIQCSTNLYIVCCVASTIVSSCSSARAFMLSLKKSWWWVHSDVIDILLSSIQQNIYLKCIEILQCTWQHQWELKNIRNWIVGFKLTKLHEKSIKNQMRWGNKSYTDWVDVYLHFMLVFEVIKLNRIINLFMTLDATYCNVPLIYGLAQIS